MPDSADMELKGMPMSETESFTSVGSQKQVQPAPEEYTESYANNGTFVIVFVRSVRFILNLLILIHNRVGSYH